MPSLSDYFALPSRGAPFVQLGAAHVLALAIIAGLAFGLPRWVRQPVQRQRLRLALAGLLLVNELGWHAWHALHGLWSLQYLLPLNICNLMVLASAWALISKKQAVYEFIYLLGVPTACQVLITPALGPFGFPHVLFFQIFISHGGIVVAALYLTLAEGMRPAGWRSVARVAGVTTAYMVAIFLLNRALGSNYLFLAAKPAPGTILDYLGPWPWYILPMTIIGLALICLLYLPFQLVDRGARAAAVTRQD
jgi:hypothetical integral membrane protein (TIGR02206 family)